MKNLGVYFELYKGTVTNALLVAFSYVFWPIYVAASWGKQNGRLAIIWGFGTLTTLTAGIPESINPFKISPAWAILTLILGYFVGMFFYHGTDIQKDRNYHTYIVAAGSCVTVGIFLAIVYKFLESHVS